MDSENCRVKSTDSHPPIDYSCRICSKNGKTSLATIFCLTCQEYQCESCAKVHNFYKFLSNHELQKATEAKPSLSRISFCDEHNESIDFFCQEHEELCCSTCAFLVHRHCCRVDEISSASELTDNDCTFLFSELCDLQTFAERSMNYLGMSEKRLQNQTQNIFQEIDDMQERMNKSFQQLSCELHKEALYIEALKAGDLDKIQKHCRELLHNLSDEEDFLDTVLNNGKPTQIFLAQHKLNEIHKSYEDDFKHETSKINSLEFNIKFEKCIDCNTDHLVGNVVTFVSLRNHTTNNKKLSFKVNANVNISNLCTEDGDLLYTAMEFLKDGRLLAIEHRHKDMLIFDKELALACSHRLKTQPFSLALLSQTEVAVSLVGCIIEFYFVSRQNTVLLLRTLETSLHCLCLRVLDRNNLVTNYVNETCLKKISLTGQENNIVYKTPLNPFSDSGYQFTFIENMEKIVTCNLLVNSIRIYDIAKDTVNTVKDNQILGPSFVAVGPSESILICCRDSHKISHISSDGKIIGTYDLGLHFPLSCSVSSDMTHFAVTSGNKEKQMLTMFDISY